MATTVIEMHASPFVLVLHTERLMEAISALRGVGLRVMGTLDAPGQYVVEDAAHPSPTTES
jgi:hypothetical protein